MQVLSLILAAAVGQVSQAATLTWDTIAGNGGTITGGSGTWTDGLGNWNTGSGDATWNSATPDSAIFGATAGTVTLGGAVTVGNMVFNSGYTLAGGGNTLTLSNSTITANVTATISAALGGSSGLSKDGTGTLTLSGANTYTGATTISGGVLNVTTLANGGSNSNIGASSNAAENLVLNGGTLRYSFGAGAAVSTDRLFSVGTSGGTLDASGGFNINFTNTGSMGFNGQSGARTLTLTGNNVNDNTLAAVIGDNGGATSVTKAGGGIWVLSGANTYTGVTTVSGTAVLKVSSLANGGEASNIGASSNAASNLVFNGGTFTYTGGTVSTDRLFSLGTSGIILNAFGTGGVNFTNTGSMGFVGTGARTLTLANSNGGASTIAAVIGDNGGATSVTHTLVSSTWVLTGANTYTGATTLNGGVLSVTSLADGGSASGIGAASSAATNLVLNGGKLLYTGGGSSTDRLFSVGSTGGTLDSSGTGAVNFTNTGSMGFNSQTGTRTLTLTGTNTGANTLAAAIGDNSGATAVAKTGAGTWVLTGTNSYTGATTISGGVLQVGNGGTSGTLGSGAVTDNGNLTFNRSDSITVANTISGSGSVTQAGAGTTTLSGTNSYLGATTISGGVLSVATLANGNSASNIGASSSAATNLVLNGGALRYTGAGVSTDRLFSVGTSGGTLDASCSGALSLTNTGSMGFNSQSGARTLTLTGTNTGSNLLAAVIGESGGATALTKAGAGAWTLSGSNSYTGATTINGGALNVTSLANGGSSSNIGASSNAASNLVLNGGTLQYNNATTTSTDRLFSVGAAGGTISLPVAATLNFTNTGNIGFNGETGARTLTFAFSNSTFGGIISLASGIGDNGGATSVVKSNTFGTLRLTSDNNTYTGTTTINGGAVAIGNLGGSTGSIGTGAIIINAGGTLFATRSGSVNLAQTISGAGGVTSNGNTMLTLSGTNTYTGVTRIISNGGVVTVSDLGNGGVASSIGASSSAAGNLSITNLGTLRYVGTGASTDRLFEVPTGTANPVATIESSGSGALVFTNTGAVGFGSSTGARTLVLGGTNTQNNTMNPSIGDNAGATALTKAGTGTWVLAGANTYSGVTTISGGVLQVGNGGTSGTLGSGAVTDNGNLTFNRSDNITVANTISGSGSVTQAGAGTTTLSGTNSYLGVTTISGGVLQVGNGGTSGTLGSGAVTDNGNLTFNRSDSVTVTNAISGSGSVTQAGAGTTTLSGTNSYLGVTTISGGVLNVTSLANGGSNSNIGASSNAASNLVLNGGTLQYNNTTTTSTDRLFSVGTAGGTISLPVVGTLTFTNTGSLGFNGQSGARTLTFAFSNSTFGGVIIMASGISDNGGATSVVKSNTLGTVRLTSDNNTYTGTTTINGALSIGTFGGSTGSIGTGAIIINAGGTLFATRSGSVNLAQTISGAGGVTSNGNTMLTLSGTNTYTGVTRIISNGGIVTVSDLGNGGVPSSIGASSSAADNLIITTVGTLRYVGTGASTDRLFSVTGGSLAVGTIDASGTGPLVFTNTGAMGFASSTGTRLLILSGSNTQNNTMTPVIGDNSGATSLTKSGTGTWVLAGTNTYTGVTTISGGVLQVGNGGTTGTLGTGAVTDNAALVINRSDAVPLANTISGTGTFTQAGTGTTTFTGTKSYSGTTFVNAGKLQAGGANAFSAGSAVTVASGAVLELNGFTNAIGGLAGSGTVQNGTATGATLNVGGSANSSFDGIIQNGGSAFLAFNKGGLGGTLTLTGSNTYTGGTVVSTGVLSVSSLANGGAASNIGASTNAASSLILTGGTLRYTGAAVSTDRLFTVTTSGGTLDASGTGAVNFTNSGSMGFNSQTGARILTLTGTNTDNNTIAAAIGDNSGATTLVKTGTGTWVLSGANTYTGTTTISGGLLQIGDGGTTGSLGSGAVANNASLVVNRSDAITIANAISGSGSLTQAGAGTTILTGTNNYGSTTISAGTLQIGNGGTTGTLGGIGTITNNGKLVINRSDAITISGAMSGTGEFIQNGTGTTTLSNYNQWGSATVNAGILTALATNSLGTTSSMTVNAAGTLMISGLSSSAAVGSLSGSGVVKNGGATASTLNVGTIISGTTTFSGTIIDGGTGTMALDKGGVSYTLILSGASTYTGPTRIFAGTLSVSNLADGGSASSIGASTSAATNLVFKTSSAVLKYTGAAVSTNRLFSVSGGGTLDASGTGALNLTNTGAMGFDGQTGARTLTLTGTNTDSNTLAAVIGDNGGATSLTKSGIGTWVLAGANTYTGTTVISGGELQIGNGGTTGSLGSGAVTDNSKLTLNRSDAFTVANTISGNGALTQAGTGTTTLSGANSYTGATTITAGVLNATSLANGGSNSNIGASSNAATNLVLDGGTLQYTGSANVSTDRLFSVGTGGGVIDASGSGTLNFTNTGSMGFNGESGARTLMLAGTNSGSNILAAVIGDNGGATSLVKSGTGTWVLTGTNTFTGTTTISAGVLQVGNGGTSGTLGTGAVTDNGNLTINHSDAITLANSISGSGSFTQAGSGTTTLTGASSYTGSTTISAGVLSVASIANGGSSSNLGASTNSATNLVLNGGTLQYTGAAASTDRLFSVGTSGGTLDASGTGALNFTNAGSMGFNSQSGTRTLTLTGTNTGDNTLAAVIGDNGGATSLVKSGTGTWVLTGTNTYTGTTTISGGVLQAGSGSTTGSLGSGAVINNGSLVINHSNDLTLANAISGSGSFTQAGSGTTTLSGTNSYTGATTISAGVLNVTFLANGGSSSNIGAAASDAANLVINGGTLQYSGAADASTDRLFSVGIGSAVIDVTGSGALNFTNTGSMGFNGQSGDRNLLLTGTNSGVNTIAMAIGDFGGATSVSIDGTATWLLTGANTYTGATTVSSGVLQIGGSNLDSAIILGSHATLELSGLNARIGSLAGSGTVQNNSTTAAALTTGGNNTSTTFSGVIQDGGAGALSIVKEGSGTFTLTGANSYTGTTTINAGVLQVGSGGTTGTLGSGAVINNASLIVNRSDTLTIANAISGSGSLTQAGAGTTTLTGDNSFSGSTTINAGVLSVAVLADGGSHSNLGASTDAATNLVLNGGTLQYTGGDVSTDRLFSVGTNGGALDASGTGAVNFTNTGSMGFNSQSGIRTLTLTGTNTGDNTLASVIGDNGGATALTKSGLGTWVLTGNNSNSGITTINAGVLQIGAGGTKGSLGSGAVTDNGSLILNRSDDITVDNAISGSGSLTQAGSGTTTLTGDNGYTGSTTINAGMLSVAVLADGGSNSNLGASTNEATNLVLNGGALQYTGADVSTDRLFSVGTNDGAIDASGTGAVNFTNTGSMGFNGQSGARTLTLTGTNAGSNTLAAVIGDNGGATALTKSGAGNWVLTGANSYTGITSISAGELQVGAGGTTGALGTGAVINNASLMINRSDALTIANEISGSGVFTQAGSGTTTLTGDNSYSGSTTINAGVLSVSVLADGGASSNVGASFNAASNLVLNGGTLQYTGGATSTDRLFSVGSNGGTLDASGTGAVNFTNTGSMGFNSQSGIRTLILTGTNTGDNTLAAVIGDNGDATTLTKSGGGTWVLGGANTYTGTTTISAGVLQIGGGGTTGSLSTSSALSNNGTLAFNRTDAVTQGADFASLISGSGGVTQAGTGTLTLNGDNTYAGTTNVRAGTLEVTCNNALGTGAAGTTVSSGATLMLNNVNYSTSEALALNGGGAGGGGALRNSGTSSYTGAITAETNASINAGGGILNLTGGLVKDGTVLTITGGGTVYVSGTGISGASASSDLVVDGTTLVVGADSDYNGPTTVQNGAALIANASVTTTRLDLSSDSLLAGTGAITTAVDQSIFINGTFSVGDPGVAATASTLALTTSGAGAVVMGADSVIRLDLFSGAGLGNNLSNATAADSINLHGKLDATAGGTVVIGNPNGMTNFRGGDQWQLVHLNSGDANAGSFASSLALNDSSLHLASGFTSYLDPSDGVFSIIDTNGGLALAAVEVQALVSGGNTVTSDLNGHLFNLRSGGGEEGDDSGSITAALDDGVIVGEGDGDPKKASPIARRVARSRQWEVFATVNYGNVKLNPIRTQSGVQIDSWASGVGAERHFSRGLTFGFAASFLQSNQGYTSNAGSLHLEGPALSSYVSYVRGSFWNSLLYSFGTYQMDSIRNPGVPFPTAFGTTRTYTHSVQYNAGWNLRFQNNTLVTGPFVGVDYLHGSVDAYNETGGGLAALHYSAQSYQSLVSRVGWSASKQIKAGFGTITPQVRLSYERQNIKSNNGTSVSLINVPFSSTGGQQAPGQDYVVAGLGVSLAFNERFSLMLFYQGQFFRRDLQAHFGSIRFSYQF